MTVTNENFCSATSALTTVTLNPNPTVSIAAGGPTTFCAGGSVTLTSSSATGNQWYVNGNLIGGATNQSYPATVSGSYTVRVTDGNGCMSGPSAATTVTVNPLPETPTITPGGPTTFCEGGSVTLTSCPRARSSCGSASMTSTSAPARTSGGPSALIIRIRIWSRT